MRRPPPPLPRSFRFAALGVRRAWRAERNLRVQASAGWAALGGGVLCGRGAADLALLTLTIGCVLGMETMNSALEAVVDLVSPNPHPLAEAAKDLAAGAVLLVSAGALGAGVWLFWPLRALPSALLAGARGDPAFAAAWLCGLCILVALACGRLPGRRSQ